MTGNERPAVEALRQAIDALGPSLPAERQNDLVNTKGSVRQALEEVRRISRELRGQAEA